MSPIEKLTLNDIVVMVLTTAMAWSDEYTRRFGVETRERIIAAADEIALAAEKASKAQFN